MQSAQAENMVRKQFLISPSQVKKLDRLAKNEGTSVAEVVRLAIDAYDPDTATDMEATELMELVARRLKEAIEDTQKTRKRLNKTLRQLGATAK